MKTTWLKKALFISSFISSFISNGFSADNPFLDSTFDCTVCDLDALKFFETLNLEDEREESEKRKIIYSREYAEKLLQEVSKLKGHKSKSFLIEIGEYVGNYKATKEDHEKVLRSTIDPCHYMLATQLPPNIPVESMPFFGAHRVATRVIKQAYLPPQATEVESRHIHIVSNIESVTAKEVESRSIFLGMDVSATFEVITTENERINIQEIWKDVGVCFRQDQIFYRNQKFIRRTDIGIAGNVDIYTIYHVFYMGSKFRLLAKTSADSNFLVLDPDHMEEYSEVITRK